ncbi:MAG: M14 family metallopeptidase [Caldilineaceae bacterium]
MTNIVSVARRRRASRLFWFLLTLLTVVGAPQALLAQAHHPFVGFAQPWLPPSTLTTAAADEIHLSNQLFTQTPQASVVARVYFGEQTVLNQLAARYDVWHVHHSPNEQTRYAVALLSDRDVNELCHQGYRLEIDEARTTQLSTQSIFAGVQQAGIPGYACYRTVEETYRSLADLATAHPQLATWTDIGNSWEKERSGGNTGYDIYALKLTNSAIPGPKPKFFLMAAIHAREYVTAELATRFAEELIAKYNIDPDVTWLLDYFEIHIVPQANPDGRKIAETETGRLWRKNIDNDDGCTISAFWGTDLNRNSSFKWNTGGSSSDTCNLTYHGPSAASEPETQTIEQYARAIFADQRGPNDNDAAPAGTEGIFISLHSYSELVLFPWGYTTTPAPNGAALQTLGRKFGYHNGYQVCTGPQCLYGTSGTTDDFTYGEFGVASYTFELGRNFSESCSFFESNIVPKNMPALYYAAKAARRPYQNPAGPEVLQATATLTGTTLLLTATVNDTRYNSNGWGVEPSQPITAARFTIDTPSWITGTQSYAMTAVDGRFDTSVETIMGVMDTSTWTAGKRLIFIEGQDTAGNWGVPTGLFVTIPGVVETPVATTTPVPTAAPTPTPTLTPTATVTNSYRLYFPITGP